MCLVNYLAAAPRILGHQIQERATHGRNINPTIVRLKSILVAPDQRENTNSVYKQVLQCVVFLLRTVFVTPRGIYCQRFKFSDCLS